MSDDSQSAPFADINIVEFGQFIAVPFCAQLLAEGGANVIKVEALEGDPTRHIGQLSEFETRIFISRNRGKRSLPLKLSDPGARPVIDALLAWADVALMNFRPGLATRLNMDAETLTQRYPQLVVGTVTAFGDKGPDAGLAGMDIVVQARSGLMAANGRIRDGRPAAGDPVVADYMCAMTLAYGISAALLRRERTGRGGTVDTSLLQAAMTLANNQLVRVESIDAPVHDKVLERLSEQRNRHAPFSEQQSTMPSARSMPLLKIYFRTYATADQDIAIACGSHRLRERFMQALGLVDTALATIVSGTARSDTIDTHYDALQLKVEELLVTLPSETWVERLQEVGVPVSPVKFPIELFDDPHIAANDMLHTLAHPTVGAMQVVAPPVRIDGEGFRPAKPTSRFASETRQLLGELGFSSATIDDLIGRGVTHEHVEQPNPSRQDATL
jgi:crotonobetainyl-CoA:carnitine CoA-transferase CaiB-like acyl-CoA transferase